MYEIGIFFFFFFLKRIDFAALGAYIMAYIKVLVPGVTYLILAVNHLEFIFLGF